MSKLTNSTRGSKTGAVEVKGNFFELEGLANKSLDKSYSLDLRNLFSRQFACVERIVYLNKLIDSLFVLQHDEFGKLDEHIVDQLHEYGCRVEDQVCNLESLAKEQHDTCLVDFSICSYCNNFEDDSESEDEESTRMSLRGVGV